MSDTEIKKYKPRGYGLLSFGVLNNHLITITLHPNSRWYAYKYGDIWVVSGAKIEINLTDEEFRRYYEQVT